MGIASLSVPCRCHVCAFFSSRDEEYDILLPFLQEGLAEGDRVVQIIDGDHRPDQMKRLERWGMDVAPATEAGQFEVWNWEDAYLRGGRFAQFSMISLLEEVGSLGERRGSGATRLWANMEWALEEFPGVHDIVEYETRLNYVLPRFEMMTVCTYDLNKFSASVVVDILRTHPQAIIGGVFFQNPTYVPPDEFLREYMSRQHK